MVAPLRHRLQKRSHRLRFNQLVSHAPRPLQFSHQLSGDHFSCFRLLNVLCLVTNRASGIFGQSPSLASLATHRMMGALPGPLATAGFVTPAKCATGTTLASTPSLLCMERERLVPLPFSVKGGSPLSLGHLS